MSAAMKAQEPLLVVTGALHAYNRSHPGSGFAGVKIDPYHGQIDVYWHNTFPASISSLLKRSTSANVHISIHPADHSLAELQAAQSILVDSLVAHHTTFASVGPNTDGSGLRLERPASTAFGPDAAISESAAVSATTGIPVAVANGSVPQLADRLVDTAPYWGGDYIQGSQSGPSCSSGFPVFAPGGNTYLLTADHCDENGSFPTWFNGNGDQIGSVAGVNPTNDAMLIQTVATDHVIWTGSSLTDPTNQTILQVNGAGEPTQGELTCTSGAYSGEECGIQTVATNLSIKTCDINGNNCRMYLGESEGDQQSHLDAAGNGDSGGPLFTIVNGQANARGTITAVDANSQTACDGVPAGNGRICSWKVFAPDVLQELTGFGSGPLGI